MKTNQSFKILKLCKWLAWSLISVLLISVVSFSIFWAQIDFEEPRVEISLDKPVSMAENGLVKTYGGCFICDHNREKYGISEIYLEGNPIERGVAFGKLAQDELYNQEKFLIDQLYTIIPSDRYLKFLRLFAILFNRNLGRDIPLEYRQEIYGMSRFCSPDFESIGPAYERQLFYHAAHDIGHIMRGYMLVGCTSFAAWGEHSQDSQLIVGRNFDFYVGDDFAKNKLISFYAPEKGYKFASVGWAGMVGVLSGMNEQGLCVTINAAKGNIPLSSAMPVSILAREILQYASNIEEAYAIAAQYKTFISESFLVVSAFDGVAVIIEKTPDQIDIYKSEKQYIICANHFQSPSLLHEPTNQRNINESDSLYRYHRMEELVKEQKISPNIAANILRNYKGLENQDIGLVNPKSINQFICHHSVVFKPCERLLWVSTTPWQMGEYVCYDLKKIFTGQKHDFQECLNSPDQTLPTESQFLQVADQVKFFREQSGILLSSGKEWSENEITDFIRLNPFFYRTYEIIGDYYSQHFDKKQACLYWSQALQKELPSTDDKIRITRKIENNAQ